MASPNLSSHGLIEAFSEAIEPVESVLTGSEYSEASEKEYCTIAPLHCAVKKTPEIQFQGLSGRFAINFPIFFSLGECTTPLSV
ncbi:MAG: hypothetical protein PVJ68_18720, partial [Candidatus Thiodiazotropha sp.]